MTYIFPRNVRQDIPMQTKLTLRLDEALIRRAKEHARKTGRSVSRMVADYFALLESTPTPTDPPTAPIVGELRGLIAGADTDEDDYRRHLDEKHG